MKKQAILVLDNYDSFTYNLVHMLRALDQEVEVFRNDEITLTDVDQYEKILLSPGPGIPKEAGILCEVIQQFGASKSILGVCLGHQAIGEVYGAKLYNLPEVLHGIPKETVLNETKGLFEGIPTRFEAARYHSWVVDKNSLPNQLIATAVDDEGEIMALRHETYDVQGVQFHPESILTPFGKNIIINWLK